ncbi:hypothetical protein Scep_026469 [Stephania cephalantha]|uniref:Uncharacterized protein n=1 Tax=Stephania cephalantha TaxID=152367 RepID=A0AAP0EMS2_9MAGN
MQRQFGMTIDAAGLSQPKPQPHPPPPPPPPHEQQQPSQIDPADPPQQQDNKSYLMLQFNVRVMLDNVIIHKLEKPCGKKSSIGKRAELEEGNQEEVPEIVEARSIITEVETFFQTTEA